MIDYLKEIAAVLLIAGSLPTLAVATWQSWKIEKHRAEQMDAEQQETVNQKGSPPWT